jgi:hypothetical protein
MLTSINVFQTFPNYPQPQVDTMDKWFGHRPFYSPAKAEGEKKRHFSTVITIFNNNNNSGKSFFPFLLHSHK